MLPEHIDDSSWHQKRLGKVTASRIADVVARTKTGWGASRANYAAELVAQRLTGVMQDGFKSAAMQWGIDQEPLALAMYAFQRDVEVSPSDFIDHPRIAMTGASPDGLVGSNLVEVKCMNTANHIETLLNQTIDRRYILQMNWQMACANAEWCDFVSFDPRMPSDLQLWVKRVERDDDLIAELEADVEAFLAEVDERVKRLEALRA
jgi:putative phage-type endonuclease